ncbi:hypothetical protein BDV98DRAFT_597435 [Pterulicium gracile]|uniref:Uncharacterized protein n=1 Tax=Pterulicium gracile TaxID=1884261 RepID=A0A5C3Q8G3_9AGAR|nr:hypothetical protein BDV98DRAFT_597435 [Pterula gracilis]
MPLPWTIWTHICTLVLLNSLKDPEDFSGAFTSSLTILLNQLSVSHCKLSALWGKTLLFPFIFVLLLVSLSQTGFYLIPFESGATFQGVVGYSAM